MSKKPLTKIQESARGEECAFRLDCCNHDRETTVLCHNTKPMFNSSRRNDARAAYGCSECHALIDSNTFNPIRAGYEWGRAIAETHVKLIEKGLLKFEGIEPIKKQLPRR